MAMSNVQRIQCGSPEVRTRTRRVGAYCRVSTLLESQQLSLETQMEGFKQKIAKTPGWKLVDIYADKLISATFSKAEYPSVLEQAMEHYRLDRTKMLRYARRRNKEKELRALIERENQDHVST